MQAIWCEKISIFPGESLQVSFVYRHSRPSSGVEVQDFALQTSDLNAIGLDITFDIECREKHVSGKICQGVREGDEIKFTATVTLKECKSGGDVAASIGVYGYNMVSAIFVTPLCACECEKVKNLVGITASMNLWIFLSGSLWSKMQCRRKIGLRTMCMRKRFRWI